MANDVAKVSVLYEGDTAKLEQANKRAEKAVKNAAQSIDKSTKNVSSSFDSMGAIAVKAFAALGAIEGGFKLASAAASALKGDTDAARGALETLPLGIGPVIASVNGLIDVLTDAEEKLSNMRKVSDILTQAGIEAREIGRTPDQVERRRVLVETQDRVKALRKAGAAEHDINMVQQLGARKLEEIEKRTTAQVRERVNLSEKEAMNRIAARESRLGQAFVTTIGEASRQRGGMFGMANQAEVLELLRQTAFATTKLSREAAVISNGG